MGGWRIAIDDCPKANRSGNCANCELVKIGGEAWFNQYKIRELRPPRPIQTERTDTGYVPLRKPLRPMQVTNRHCALGEFIRVGHTTFAAPVLSWNGKPIETSTRRTAELYRYVRTAGGKQIPENAADIIRNMINVVSTDWLSTLAEVRGW
jgi:hypothetical protein